MTRVDLTGRIFGRLKVIKVAEEHSNHTRLWHCKCECGTEKLLTYGQLKVTRSCGCFRNEQVHKSCFKGFEEIGSRLWGSIKRSARIRGLSFNINIEQIWRLFLDQNRKCALSGLPICFAINESRKNCSTQTASLDRIDSSKGYELNNVQWVHKKVNVIKNDLNDEELAFFCEQIWRRRKCNSTTKLYRDITDLKAVLTTLVSYKPDLCIGLTSGGYDCVHVGHIRCLQTSQTLVDRLVVIVNDDDFLIKKKGYCFIPLEERLQIMASFEAVDYVLPWHSDDGTVAKAIEVLKPTMFMKGGDRDINNMSQLEIDSCENHDCKIIYGVGGGKIQSSSKLVEKICTHMKTLSKQA